MVPGKTIQHSLALRDARAIRIAEARIEGRTMAEVAALFNVSVDTVERDLKKVEKQGLLDRYNDFLVGKLGNLALKAYETALEKGDTAVATKVLETLGLLRKPREAAPNDEDRKQMTWEAYMASRTPVAPEAPRKADPGEVEVIDVEATAPSADEAGWADVVAAGDPPAGPACDGPGADQGSVPDEPEPSHLPLDED